MTQDEFNNIWEKLYQWKEQTRSIFELGINLSIYDKLSYDIIISLLKCIYNAAQVDLIIFSIFDETKEITIDEQNIIINTAEKCWNYISLLQDIND